MKNNIGLIILLAFFMVSCNTSRNLGKKTLSFKYVTKGVGSCKLVLDKEGRFSYSAHAGLLDVSSKGNWINQDSQIILKSDSIYRNGFIEVKQLAESQDKDSIKIKVLSMEYEAGLGAVVVGLGTNRLVVSDSNGFTSFARNNIDSLNIFFLGDEYLWTFKEQPKGDIEVYLNSRDISKTYFDNETWIIKGRKLISPSGGVYKLKN